MDITDEYEHQLAQLDPGLRARVEARLGQDPTASEDEEDDLATLMELAPGQDEGHRPGDNLGSKTPGIVVSRADEKSEQADLGGSLAHVLTGDPVRVAAAGRSRLPSQTLNPHTAAVKDWLDDDQAGALVSARAGKAGMTGHRGVLFPGQYVDRASVVAALEERLGVTAEEFRAVYGGRKGGPLPKRLRELRTNLNAVLERVEAEGGSLALLAQWMGVNPRALQRALERHSPN